MKILKPKFWDSKSLSLFSIVFLPISFFYKLILYVKEKISKQKKFSVPVICVGNIYIGGTGKTPVSIKIFEILKELKMNPVIIKKNYKDQKDEILLTKKYCEILVGSKRELSIEEAIEKKFNIIILDDGYQDFGIKKDMNIVCFNENQQIGNGFSIPSGPLRQSLKSLRNCNVVFYNGTKDRIFEQKIKKHNPKIEFVYYKYEATNINEFKNKKLITLAGIGNPDNFFNFLEDYKLNIIKKLRYPDHYSFSKKNLDNLLQLKIKYNAKLVTTEKDYMRIDPQYINEFDFIPIKIRLQSANDLTKILRKNIL